MTIQTTEVSTLSTDQKIDQLRDVIEFRWTLCRNRDVTADERIKTYDRYKDAERDLYRFMIESETAFYVRESVRGARPFSIWKHRKFPYGGDAMPRSLSARLSRARYGSAESASAVIAAAYKSERERLGL